MRLLISGESTGTNVGGSFERAVIASGFDVRVVPLRAAFGGSRWWRTVSWRLLGHRPPTYRRYQCLLIEQLRDFRPCLFLTTGVSPVARETLATFRSAGTLCVNFSTDDPWNPLHRSSRFLSSILEYDAVFTPRRANNVDFWAAGVRALYPLPFAYDPDLLLPDDGQRLPTADVVFVGGGDRDRVKLLTPIATSGLSFAVYGSFWGRSSAIQSHLQGQVGMADLAAITRSAKVNLILVRRANRDGHVMRSFEAAACGGCLLVEETDEHREIFGDTVTYFRTPDEMVRQTRALLTDPDRRRASAEASYRRIVTNGKNTYADRLHTILKTLGVA